MDLPIDALSGEEVQRFVGEVMSTSPAVVARARAVLFGQ